MSMIAKAPKVCITVSFDADLAKWLRRHSATTEITVSRIVNRAVRDAHKLPRQTVATNGDHKPAA